MNAHKKGPNRLLQWILLVSCAVHMVLLWYITGIYDSTPRQAIELTLQNVSDDTGRNIPRPRRRPKRQLEPHEVKEHRIKNPVPRFKPFDLDTSDADVPDGVVEEISAPEVPGMPDLSGAGDAAPVQYASTREYLGMVRRRIERYKQYPYRARTRRIEGRVTVRFVITADGNMRELKTIRAAHSPLLTEAALQAVNDASPFPPPPRRYFGDRVPVEITIAFELHLR